MKTFLVKDKKPVIKWGSLPENTFFEGIPPTGFLLAVSPSENYIVLDVDRHDSKDGFDNLPSKFYDLLENTLNYPTKNNGKHYWFKYSGEKHLMNKTSGLGIDLRTNKGYVVWYPKEDIRVKINEVTETTPEFNDWLEFLFGPIK